MLIKSQNKMTPAVTLKNKKMAKSSHFFLGGELGIRTPGSSHFNGFQDRRFRPLSQLSILY